MHSASNNQMKTPLDSLDLQHQDFNRSRTFVSDKNPEERFLIRNFYRQELDEIMDQKNKYRSMEKQKAQEERRLFNQRLRIGQEAQRLKELSYKNYYQTILNNQQNVKNKYISPFQERDELKNRLINKGLEQEKIRSQQQYQRELRRQENIRKQFQSILSSQLQEREIGNKRQYQEKNRNNQQIRQILLTPQEIQRLERERKLNEMNKYREDLDKLKEQRVSMTQSQIQNPQTSTRSSFKPDRHDLLLNPLPFNIQNPYILKQMQRKNMLSNNCSQRVLTNSGNVSPTRNNIFG